MADTPPRPAAAAPSQTQPPSTAASPDEDLAFASVAVLSDRIARRQVSPVHLAEVSLERLERIGGPLAAVATLTRERALDGARAAERALAAGRSSGPLHGIPYGAKDLLDTRGIRTTFGARPFADRTPTEDAEAVARLERAGAVLVAKLAMIELAGGVGYHSCAASLTGACRTPWDRHRWAGGSSSGSGAAVAAGLVPFALGSETWGSILCPAAFCGVTGLRPTYGVVSRRGAMPLAYSMDKLGVLARTALDAHTVLSALAGRDPRDASSVDAPDLRLPKVAGLRAAVVDPTRGRSDIGPAWKAAFAHFVDELRALGLIVEEAELPPLPYEPLALLVWQSESRSALEDLLRDGRWRQLADTSSWLKLERGESPPATAPDYVKGMRLRTHAREQLANFFARHDLVVAPSSFPYPAPPVEVDLDTWFTDLPDPLGAAGNVLGLPAIGFPIGFTDEKFPIGAQLLGPALGEARLVAVAAAYQARTGHHLVRPPR